MPGGIFVTSSLESIGDCRNPWSRCPGTIDFCGCWARHVEVYPFALMDARTASEKDLCVFEMLGSKRCKLIVTLVTIIQTEVIILWDQLLNQIFFPHRFCCKGTVFALAPTPKRHIWGMIVSLVWNGYHPGSTTQIELERTTLQPARRTIDGASMLGISWNLRGSDDKLQVIIIRMENPSWFPQVPSKISQKYTKIMENHPLSISFLNYVVFFLRQRYYYPQMTRDEVRQRQLCHSANSSKCRVFERSKNPWQNMVILLMEEIPFPTTWDVFETLYINNGDFNYQPPFPQLGELIDLPDPPGCLQVILLKQWDSDGWLHGGSRANFTLHSAFKDPSSPEDGEDRVSCEVAGRWAILDHVAWEGGGKL